MPVLELTTLVAAPVERVFDLSRSIDLHTASTAATGERAVAGVTSGLIGPGEEVTWRARHFGVWQSLTSRIVIFDRPRHFRDSMVRGAFRRFDHDHRFEPCAEISACSLHDRIIEVRLCAPRHRLPCRIPELEIARVVERVTTRSKRLLAQKENHEANHDRARFRS